MSSIDGGFSRTTDDLVCMDANVVVDGTRCYYGGRGLNGDPAAPKGSSADECKKTENGVYDAAEGVPIIHPEKGFLGYY